MKHVRWAAFLLASFPILAPVGHACSCRIPDVSEELARSDAVFIGEVTEVTAPRAYKEGAPLTDRAFAFKMKVEKTWKGDSSQEVTVLSSYSSICSTLALFKGGKYLIYVSFVHDDQTIGQESLAVHSPCSRSARLAWAARDIMELNASRSAWL